MRDLANSAEKSNVRANFPLVLGIFGALLFVLLSSLNLTAQGPYQDELHQAAGSFCYLGSPPEKGVSLHIGGIPLLNTRYSGAIKTAVYGLYLRFVNPQFSLVSWRLLGILFVAAGILLFCSVTRKSLNPLANTVFLVLLLTDVSVLLASRHDWGPVALGLFLRLLFLAVWLSGEGKGTAPSLGNSFALGCLVGVAVFEKLSSFVLIFPLGWIFLQNAKRRSFKHGLSTFGGLAAGSIPLVVVNFYSVYEKGYLISLRDFLKGDIPALDWSRFLGLIQRYLELGNGRLIRRFILGDSARWTDGLELLLIGLILILILVFLFLHRRHLDVNLCQARTAILSYLSIGIALYFLPRGSWAHHWILGTPFQYLAIVLAAQALTSKDLRGLPGQRKLRYLFVILFALWVPLRVANAISLEQSLYRGKSSARWHPDVLSLAEFAVPHSNDAVFIAGNWGVAYPIYCFANGQQGFVYELYFNYRGPNHLRRIQEASGKQQLYVVGRVRQREGVMLAKRKRIEADLERLPQWEEIAVPDLVSKLEGVWVRRFLYRPEKIRSSKHEIQKKFE